MPAGRFRRYNRKPMRKSSKTKTDRKQSRQIAKIKRAQFTRVYTTVAQNDVQVGVVATAGDWGAEPLPYIQPISCALEQGVNQTRKCASSQGAMLAHERKFQWGIAAPNDASDSVEPYYGGSGIKTTHCRIDYRLLSTEPNMVECCVAVISPKKRFADQLTRNRQLKLEWKEAATPGTANYVAPGTIARLSDNLDYSCSGDLTKASLFSVKWNPQRWNVHYMKNHRLQAPTGTAPDNEVGITNTYRAPNNQMGRINLKMNTYLRGPLNYNLGGVGGDDATSYASQARFGDVPNDELRYLVCIVNDIISPAHHVSLSTTQNFTHQVYSTGIMGAP